MPKKKTVRIELEPGDLLIAKERGMYVFRDKWITKVYMVIGPGDQLPGWDGERIKIQYMYSSPRIKDFLHLRSFKGVIGSDPSAEFSGASFSQDSVINIKRDLKNSRENTLSAKKRLFYYWDLIKSTEP